MDINDVNYINLKTVLQRGTAEIIEETDDVLFLYDSVSETYMLGCENEEHAEDVIVKHEDLGYDVMELDSKKVAEFAMKRYDLDNCEECYQFAYLGDIPEQDPRITMKQAESGDIPLIMRSYDMISEDDMAFDVNRGNVYLAYDGDDLVGFMGEHSEGSQGMLYIYPEFRRKGYASAIENASFARCIRNGYTPFGQVITNNNASYSLQKKKDLKQAEKLIYWIY